jgi:hypothetical protein
VAAPELNSARRRGPGHVPRGSTEAHLTKEVRSGSVGHVAALEPTSVGRCGPKLQFMWQHVDARPTPYLDLELVCEGTRSSGCRQRPPNSPRESLRTRRWGQFFDALLDYLELFTRQSTTGPQEVPELEVRKLETWMMGPLGGCRHGPIVVTTDVEDVDDGQLGGATGKCPTTSTTEVQDIDCGPPGGATGKCPIIATTEVQDNDCGPPGGAGGKVQQRPPRKLKTSMAGPLGVLAARFDSDHHRC